MSTLIIRCPKCGQEYLPAEIYYPNDFLGKPNHILKDSDGKIENYQNNNMNLEETYICDKCKTKFKTIATVDFTTEIIADTDSVYRSKIRQHNLFFNEE